MEVYFAAAYWGPRKELINDCVARTTRFLKDLDQVSNLFSGWRSGGRSKKEAIAQKIILPGSIEELRTLFEIGRNRRDMDKSIIDELGFSVGFWNGRSSPNDVSLSIHCGLYSQVRGLSNSVVMTPLRNFTVASQEKVLTLARSFAEAWEPDSFILTRKARNREAHAQAQAAHRIWEPFLDVALYLKGSLLPSLSPKEFDSIHDLKSGRIFLKHS